jgi:pectate lyase
MSHGARAFVSLVAIGLVVGIGEGVSGEPLEGFGTTTLGGSAGAIVHVTTLADSGPGSLREALQGGNRTVVFDVAGDIALSDHVYVRGANVTIDATTAPAPGITLRNRGLIIRGNKGAHDVIVRGIRVRDSSIDGIQVAYGAFNVVLDGVSVSGSLDGDIDITDSHDVTISWSILGANGKNMLIKYGSSRITLHHVAFVNSLTRNPQVAVDDEGSPATDLVADVRNNVVTGWGIGYGTLVWKGARANVVNNYYAISDDALTVTGARAYVSGNVSGDGVNINEGGTEPQPFPSPAVTTQDACTAAWAVLAAAGVRPLDAVDQKLLDSVTIACAALPAGKAMPPSGRWGIDFAPAPRAIPGGDLTGTSHQGGHDKDRDDKAGHHIARAVG